MVPKEIGRQTVVLYSVIRILGLVAQLQASSVVEFFGVAQCQ